MIERLLLDTTYLLPIFGVYVKLEGYEELFPKVLDEFTVMYSPISLIESKWIILSLAKNFKSRRSVLLESYRKGLKAILNDERLTPTETTSPDIEEVADKLLELGVKDYFDRMIYASSTCYNAILLTEDEELMRVFSLNNKPKPRAVLNWIALIKEKLR